VARVDDPQACEIVNPVESDRQNRATVRPIAGHRGSLKVDGGFLHGMMLPPRTGAVFVQVKE
jgi:hypothetical protein